MAQPLILAVFIEDSDFQLAVRQATGEVASGRFANDADGIAELAGWLREQVTVDEGTVAHACVAVASGSAQGYSSAAFEFAHNATENTFLWGPLELARLDQAAAANVAAAMLELCEGEHAKGA